MTSPSTARTARLVATTLITAASCLGVAAVTSAPAASAASPAVTHAIAGPSTGDTTPWGAPSSGAPTS